MSSGLHFKHFYCQTTNEPNRWLLELIGSVGSAGQPVFLEHCGDVYLLFGASTSTQQAETLTMHRQKPYCNAAEKDEFHLNKDRRFQDNAVNLS